MTVFNGVLVGLLLSALLAGCDTNKNDEHDISGLRDKVELLRDSFGINHIYARNQHDLFFMQGYAAANDRLFQFEIWRRQATGTLSEVFGTRTLKKDVGARLFKYRGNLSTELNYYHPEGEEIINAYVDGVNAYIDKILETPEHLPIEFKLFDIRPGKWTADIVISRHNGWLGNVQYELDYGRAVAIAGVDAVKDAAWFHPKDPDITLDTMITKALLEQDILELYNAFREPVEFATDDIAEQYQSGLVSENSITKSRVHLTEGSNNWVINGEKSSTGFPMLANDPHRSITVPSLRYSVHLVAPGWNVIGGGEPAMPGVSIGHNEKGAWGLTIFESDSEDLYVYKLNPENLRQYRYKNAWVDMEVVKENILVRDESTLEVDLYFTRHGPVTFIDSTNLKAFAVRCAWLEPGGAPYLASLRMDQAASWEEFRDACNYSHIPGENMVWADVDGNIGWQAVGIAPVRQNFSGLVPVPGDGRYEWDGYLPIKDKPHVLNPPRNFIETANENITPENYEHWDAIAFEWEDAFRGERIKEVLESQNSFVIDEMKSLQVDYLSRPASILVPYLLSLEFSDQAAVAAERLGKWDFKLLPESTEAGVYVAWENEIRQQALESFVDPGIQNLFNGEQYLHLQLTKIIDWIERPDKKFGSNPVKARDEFLKKCFIKAIDYMEKKFGKDQSLWQYGQVNYKHIYIEHPLASIVNDSLKKLINVGPAVRGGYGYTVGYTSSDLNQSSGASFRMIMDLSDWDHAIGTNTPGQSGDPASPYYKNLFDPWSKDQFFPFYYSRKKVESITADHMLYKPGK